MALEQGEVFAGYTIIRRLGAGGMGEVYLAQHPRLPRQDAIKVLPPHLASDGAFRQRFLREADLAATLNHPNVVGILDRGEDGGRLWLTMPYIDGIDAAERLRGSPRGLSLDEVVSIVSDTAAALDFAHQRGVLHRDVKPANILLDGSRALLTDFGIARAANDTSDLTATGTTIGSVAYASPEQLRGEQVGPAADVYSLAATAYALLTGLRPFDRSSPSAVIAAALEGTAPSAVSVRSDLPPAVDIALAHGMSRAPGDRPSTAGGFVSELNAARDSSDTTTLRRSPASGAEATLLAPARTHAAIPPDRTRPTPSAPARRRWALPAAAVAVLLIGAGAAGALVLRHKSEPGSTAAAAVPGSSTATSSTLPPPPVSVEPSTVTIVAPTPIVTVPAVRPYDLGLVKPVSTPACDGRFIVVLESIEESNPSLRALITSRLSAEPRSQYFYSGALNCNSINAVNANGERFYTPYVDYGPDLKAACYALQHRGGSYVRTLRNGVAVGTNPCE
ncbi:hypothetical protein GCM10027289_21960 [Tsukamurella serpentis]